MKAAHQLSLVVSLTSCMVHRDILFYVLFDDKRLHVYMVCIFFNTFGKCNLDA